MSITEIPERITYLILLYMHGQLTQEQHNELDEWVVTSNKNMELFAAATDEHHIKLSLVRYIYGNDYNPVL